MVVNERERKKRECGDTLNSFAHLTYFLMYLLKINIKVKINLTYI
jgi:hypothetical protein